MKEFLRTSPIAATVKLGSTVVLHRRKMNTEELLSLESQGSLQVSSDPDETYELEINGTTIARGAIVRKRGEYFFKVKEMLGESER